MQLAANVVIAERFRLNRQLGRGGMGSVWHATHLGLDTPCALKFIEASSAQLPEAQARFEREAKAAAHLRSPHVVQILDHGVWQGTPYIAMELLDGEDLGKRLLRVGRLPPFDVVRTITQICRALTKAHAVGIVHRDLKPDNIFLVRDDDRELVKVVDFGIAKATGKAIEGSQTRTGALLGTPYYMSPEQAQGTKAVDHRSDLWSLAVIAFQALTGRLPFESEALGDLLVKIIVTPVPVPSHYASDLTPAFDEWWAKASMRDPSGRFQTAREFAEALSFVFFGQVNTDSLDRMPSRAPEPMLGGTSGSVVGPLPASLPRSSSYPPAPGGGAGTLAIPHMDAPRITPVPVIPTTAAPMSRTFGNAPASGKKRTAPLVLGIAAVGLVLAVVGVSIVVSRSGAHATAAMTATVPPAPPPPPQTTPIAPPPPPPTPAQEVLTPPAGDTAGASSVAADGSSAPKPHEAEKPHGPAVTPPPAAHTGRPAGTPSAKPPRVDLGI